MMQLLEKVKIIDFKYKALSKKEEFNLFKILRKYDDEVNLHSRFISELLNPNGTHGLGEVFLKLFLEVLNYENFVFSDKIKVFHEKYIGEINETKTKGGQIDLLIENISENIFIIENKIHAEDQENQLLRYKNYNTDSNLFYLTLQGDEPSEYSLGTLTSQEVTCISYKNEIREWLKMCIEKSAQNPTLRESLNTIF